MRKRLSRFSEAGADFVGDARLVFTSVDGIDDSTGEAWESCNGLLPLTDLAVRWRLGVGRVGFSSSTFLRFRVDSLGEEGTAVAPAVLEVPIAFVKGI